MTLRERRMRLDMSLGEFARACNIGTAVASSIERGLAVPPTAVIADIARVLGCTVEEVRHNLPDPEQAKLDTERLARLMSAVGAAKADAKLKGYGRGSAGRSSIPCPACKTGTLRYSVAALNGHMHGACTTQDCARWME